MKLLKKNKKKIDGLTQQLLRKSAWNENSLSLFCKCMLYRSYCEQGF